MTNLYLNKQGFTLIELLIVTAIIGILAMIALPQFGSYKIRGQNATAASDIKILKGALEAYYAEHRSYP